MEKIDLIQDSKGDKHLIFLKTMLEKQMNIIKKKFF